MPTGIRTLVILAVLFMALQPASADPSAPDADGKVPDAVMSSLGQWVPGVQPSSVRPSPVKGLYEVAYEFPDQLKTIIYVSSDGRFMVRGDIIEPEAGRNHTEEMRSAARMEVIEGLGEASMVVFAPKKTKHTVNVFTDIDCPYCRKFHQEVGELNRKGVKVRYLAYPRSRQGSRAYEKAVAVWCAEDRSSAMTDAKAGKEVPKNKCENPIDKHVRAGRSVGVTGTPAIVLDDGRIVPGYVPAKRLVKELEAEQQ